jgi:hypothetical protein
MNLVSCNACGVVIDADKLKFPSEDDMWDTDEIDTSKFTWSSNSREYVSYISCPVCESKIEKE